MIVPVSLIGSIAGNPTAVVKKVEEVGSSFADTLSQVMSQGAASIRGADQIAAKGIQGAVPTQDVVDAVMSAERTLQTAISIRDKLVSAYQEISRMTI